jgi:signal transduction histidine kinase
MPRHTLRLRLTLLYTGVFSVAGAALLGATYALVARSLPVVHTQGPTLSAQLAQLCAERGRTLTPNQVLKCKIAFTSGVRQGASAGHSQTLHNLLVYSTVGLLAMAAVVAAVGWVVAGRALRPLQEITATARRLSARSLDQRLNREGPRDELHELSDTFDEMLDRLSASFVAQQRFVANASHELRTPLTIMRTELDVTLASPDTSPAGYRRMADVLTGAIARSESLVDALLTLAYSDRGQAATTPVELGPIVRACVDEQRPAAAARGIAITTDISDVTTSGDHQLLRQLAQNLLDNSVRHNIPNGHVQVAVGPDEDGTRARIQIANSSTPLADHELESIFEPFHRPHGDRIGGSGGHGLGLSIVRSVATAHDGAVAARSESDGTFRIEVILPV